LTAELAAAGVPVVDEPPYGHRTTAKLDHLTADNSPSGDGDGTTGRSVEAHARCPGHAAYLRDRGAWSGTPDITAVYVCTDWQSHGHQPRFTDTPHPVHTGGSMSEQAKTERRQVIANNKAWDAAWPVRRRCLSTFLTRRIPPKDAPAWIAATLASCAHDVRRAMDDGHQTALQLLGLAGDTGDQRWRPYDGTPNPAVAAAAAASPARATMLTVGLLLGALESTLTRSSWRSATAAQRAYFTALQQWSYPLSKVEQLVITSTPDTTAPQPDLQPQPHTDQAPAADTADTAGESVHQA
jgi:ParB family chromosome partitioning protein